MLPQFNKIKGYRPDFRNVLITPQKSYLKSRKDVNLNTNFTFKTPGGEVKWSGVPIISSNMDTVSNVRTCEILRQNNYLTCFPKHFNKEFDNYLYPDELHCVENYMLSCGTNDYQNAVSLIDRLCYDNIKVKFLCVDIANGYLQQLQDTCKYLRNKFPDMVLAAGNVVTPEIVDELISECGVNIVKVGIGSGSVCETRLKTGIGYPQLGAVIECAWAAETAGGYIISDGGVSSPSDICKAFAGGADFVMVGGMFAGHEESPGDTIIENDERYKLCYGMSSKEANEKYNGGMKDYRTSEGKVKKIKMKGSLEETIKDINGGIRSACTYVNARNLRELSENAEFTLN
uniref:GMP reductase n=1 Tax=viral metagenome TaxID=1070528 RepID=A0A6C0B0H2_9ZZZZ